MNPETPNQALQRTAPAGTLAASAAALPPTMQPARQPPQSLSLGSFGQRTKRTAMRPLLSLVFLAAAALAADDSWMKPPDGYAWPDEASTQPEKDTQLQLSDVPAVVRAYVVDQYLPQKPPATVYVRRADLNGDGVAEWFIDRPELGGTGGGVYDILDISGKAAKSLGSLLGGFHLCVAAPREKWLRIECSSRAGGGHFTRYLLQYGSGEYQTVRNEDHDMIHKTVTIRKVEKP